MSEVFLNVYDLSNGLARTMSMALVGQQIDGIWHTGIVCFGREWFFGGGVFSDIPGQTPYGSPVRCEQLGRTEKNEAQFFAWLRTMAASKYHQTSYNLFSNNCNDFTDDAAMFLLNRHIPDEIRHLPSRFLNSPMGQAIAPMLSQQVSQINDYAASHHGQVFSEQQAQPTSANITEHHQPVVFGDPGQTAGALTKIIERVENDCAELFRTDRKSMAQLHNLKTLLKHGSGALHQSEISLLQKLSEKLQNQSFAVVDLLRLSAAASSGTRASLVGPQGQPFLMSLRDQFASLPPGVRLMVLRLFANLLAAADASETAVLCSLFAGDFVTNHACAELRWDRTPKGMTRAAAAFFYNLVLRRPPASNAKDELTPVALAAIECLADADKCREHLPTALLIARLLEKLQMPELIRDLDLDVAQLERIDPAFKQLNK